MKNWLKYIISAVIFFVVFIGLEYLLTKNIEWDMVIASTLLYYILNAVFHTILDKKLK